MIQALGFFMTRLDMGRNKKLMKDVMFNPLKDLSDAYERAEKFIAIDEAMASLQSNSKGNDHLNNNKNEDNKANVWDRVRPKGGQATVNKPPFQPRMENKVYTPLNTSRVQILEEIKGKPIFEPPQPKCHPRRGDKIFFCNYHQAVGHSTEACFDLKELIERKVQNGELRQYVVDQKTLSPDQTKESGQNDDHGGRPRRVID